MLKECLEVFGEVLEQGRQNGKDIILDSYIPADGTYIFVDRQGNIKDSIEIKLNKKTREIETNNTDIKELCFYDYHSQLVSMNKPVDGKKVIHSNNFYSFFVKKDSIVTKKLTEAIIDGYYEVLKDPLKKKYQKSKEASKIYELFEASEGAVSTDELEKNRQWIKSHIFDLDEVDLSRKDYLKIFFETEHENVEREERRYLLPNIYNNNEYNVEVGDSIYGLPDNNQGMNAKKPYLAAKTRKIPVSYLLNGEEVMLQRLFFDYLMNLASAGKCDVYIDTVKRKIRAYAQSEEPQDVEAGYYLRIKKGKELEIQKQDNIPGFHQILKEPFDFFNVSGCRHTKHPEYQDKYKRYYTREEIGKIIHEVFFSNYLESNYHVDISDIKIKDEILKNCIIISKDTIFAWVRLGIDQGFFRMLEKVSLDLIKNTVVDGYRERASWQLNLRWSFENYFLEGEEEMVERKRELVSSVKRKVFEEKDNWIENDEEYYYAVGQMTAYLISLSKSKNKKEALINPILNAKKDEVLKMKLVQLYKKYNHAIPFGMKRVNRLLAMIEEYVPSGNVSQDMVIFGYVSDNIIYMKEEK